MLTSLSPLSRQSPPISIRIYDFGSLAGRRVVVEWGEFQRAVGVLLGQVMPRERIVDWWLRGDCRRAVAARIFFCGQVKAAKDRGAVFILALGSVGVPKGVAILLPPTLFQKASVGSQRTESTSDVQAAGRKIGRLRMVRSLGVGVDNAHLLYVGVIDRRRGVGSKLLEAVKIVCQEKGWRVILETGTRGNVSFYRCLHWHVVEVIKDLPGIEVSVMAGDTFSGEADRP